MEIAVLLEPRDGQGYRAISLTPPRLVTEAPTREEALEQLRQLVHGQFAHGELVRLEVSLPGEVHPWKAIAGTWKNHPDAVAFEQSMLEYRRQIDADPDRG